MTAEINSPPRHLCQAVTTALSIICSVQSLGLIAVHHPCRMLNDICEEFVKIPSEAIPPRPRGDKGNLPASPSPTSAVSHRPYPQGVTSDTPAPSPAPGE